MGENRRSCLSLLVRMICYSLRLKRRIVNFFEINYELLIMVNFYGVRSLISS